MVSFKSVPTIFPSPIVPGPPMKTSILEHSFIPYDSKIETAVLIANHTQLASLVSGSFVQPSGCKSSKKLLTKNDTSLNGIINLGL